MCTAFRDGLQSTYGGRAFREDYLPAVEAARDAGINYFEAGGGALFQSPIFYCRENSFETMDSFRVAAGPDAELQTLARGVNVVCLDSQPSDIIQMHAQLFKKHGIDTIRNFDALNDVENLVYSGQCIVDAGLKHQVCVTMMELPPGCEGAHDPEFYVGTVRKILDSGVPFDSICFKDASGTAVPLKVHETIQQVRKIVPGETIIHFHTHETAGISIAANMAALDAGANAIDLSLAPCSGGTCQPDVVVMCHALRESQHELDIDIDKVREVEQVYQDCMSDYQLPPEALAVDPRIVWSPMPGGALTANTQMLRDNNILDRYSDMIKAMSEVVMRGGFGTSVTPVSQFYFQQAFNNVMFGPWERIAEGYGKMVLGYFGKTPVSPDPEIVNLAAAALGLKPTERSPRDIDDEDPNKGIEAARKRLQEETIPDTDENIFIAAACGEKGITFLKDEGEIGVRKESQQPATQVVTSTPKQAAGKQSTETPSTAAAAKPEGPSSYTLSVNGKKYALVVDENRVVVDGKEFDVHLQSEEVAAPMPTAPSAATEGTPVNAQMPGKVIRLNVAIGNRVESGQALMIVEAMKMEMPINTPIGGTVINISVQSGEQVATGQLLASIG